MHVILVIAAHTGGRRRHSYLSGGLLLERRDTGELEEVVGRYREKRSLQLCFTGDTTTPDRGSPCSGECGVRCIEGTTDTLINLT